MHEVELDIPPPPQLLPLLLLLREGHILPALDERHIRRQKRQQTVLDEGEEVLAVLFRLVEVVEEDPPDAARLAAVLDAEILIAPFLEARVVGAVVLVAGGLDGAVEVDGVLVEEVGRGEVGAAAEPPGVGGAVGVGGFEVAVVEVHGRGHGVVRVQDHAEAGGEELEALDVRVQRLVVDAHLLDRGAGQAAVHDGGVDAGFFEDVAVLEHAADAAAAVGARPGVGAEFVPVELLEGGDDGRLLGLDEGFHA